MKMIEDLKRLDASAKEYYYNGDFQNALLTYAEVFAKYPYVGLAYNNYGNILRELGLTDLSFGFLETAVKIEPNNETYKFNLAIAHLIHNDLKNGWELFESRWGFKGHEHTLLGYNKPRWEGQDLKGKRLLVTCEEGDGDNIQFSRFTQHLESLGAHVIHQTEPGLFRLFTSSFPNATVITNKDVAPDYDYWTPILSIPRVLGMHSYDDMPYVFGYLKPGSAYNPSILGPKEKIRIGICWSGRTKSYPFDKILSLVKNNTQFQWVNFQVQCNAEERKMLTDSGVTDLSPFIRDWDDTASVMNQIDLMISIDTGLCHIAGGLGIPCVLLLDKFTTCWRWLLNREDTVWYPSVRIIKQTSHHGYDEQLSRVQQHLHLLKS